MSIAKENLQNAIETSRPYNHSVDHIYIVGTLKGINTIIENLMDTIDEDCEWGKLPEDII